ncbi:MAG TPA: hypothetical protein VNS46_21035 [Nocardioides sp.]|nr:hypothetical protein [Nocardioides sp.]
MSQTAAPQAAPPAVVPAPAATPAPAPADASHVDTPALLNRWQLIGMTVAIVFGILSALVQFLGWQADGRAADDTEQLVRVQGIQSSLLRADALATNAFLVGGLEDPEQRAEYDAAIDLVLTEITAAADAQPADRAVLQKLNVAVNDYVIAVAQARDYNRLGYPVGAEYLSGASNQLRTSEDGIRTLDALADANTARAEESMNGQHPFWLLLVGLLALVGLLLINQQMARHFRRRINKGIATAAAIVLAVTLIGVVGAWIRDSSNDSLREGDLALAIDQANARTSANDAKANESLALIKRGSGSAFLERWDESAATVQDSLRRDSGDAWAAYVAQHAEIVRLDEAGDWTGARDLATSTEDGMSSALISSFDKTSAAIVTSAEDSVTDGLESWRALALAVSILSLLLGAVAAAFVARGIGERRKEFS